MTHLDFGNLTEMPLKHMRGIHECLLAWNSKAPTSSKPGVIEYLYCKFFSQKKLKYLERNLTEIKRKIVTCVRSHCGSWINATRSCSWIRGFTVILVKL